MGFEPTVQGLPTQRFSRPSRSTAPAPLRGGRNDGSPIAIRCRWAGARSCSTGSRSSGSTSARRCCACATAGPGRRCCCCTGTRARTRRGTASRRCWRATTPSSAPTCAATASRPSRRRRPTTRRTPSARWPATCVALMRALGHERFAVAGHDRGAYVALRTALDHPGRGRRALAVLDAVPIARGARPLRRPLRRELVALVLLRRRPTKPAERGHHRRPRRLVHGRPRADGRGELRRLPPRDPRPGDGARDGRGLPRGARDRPRARRGGPRRRPPRRLPDARRCGRSTTTWRSSTAIRWRSGARGRTTCAAARIDSGHHMAEEAPDRARRRAAGVPQRLMSCCAARPRARRRRRGTRTRHRSRAPAAAGARRRGAGSARRARPAARTSRR